MGLINWIFDFYQQYRIDQLQKETAQAQAAVRTPTGALDADRLEQAIGELALAVKTIQRIVVEKGISTPDELHAKLRQIDLEDGQADGRAPVR